MGILFYFLAIHDMDFAKLCSRLAQMRDDSIWNDVTEMLNLSEPSEISSHWALEEYVL